MSYREPTAMLEDSITLPISSAQRWWDRISGDVDNFFARSTALQSLNTPGDAAGAIFNLATLRHHIQMTDYPPEAQEAYKTLVRAMSMTLRSLSAIMGERHTDALMLNAYARYELYCLHSYLDELGIE